MPCQYPILGNRKYHCHIHPRAKGTAVSKRKERGVLAGEALKERNALCVSLSDEDEQMCERPFAQIPGTGDGALHAAVFLDTPLSVSPSQPCFEHSPSAFQGTFLLGRMHMLLFLAILAFASVVGAFQN